MPSRHIRVARVGVEPTAFPGLSRDGLPVAYLASAVASDQWLVVGEIPCPFHFYSYQALILVHLPFLATSH